MCCQSYSTKIGLAATSITSTITNRYRVLCSCMAFWDKRVTALCLSLVPMTQSYLLKALSSGYPLRGGMWPTNGALTSIESVRTQSQSWVIWSLATNLPSPQFTMRVISLLAVLNVLRFKNWSTLSSRARRSICLSEIYWTWQWWVLCSLLYI